jgi:hypothetical protein
VKVNHRLHSAAKPQPQKNVSHFAKASSDKSAQGRYGRVGKDAENEETDAGPWAGTGGTCFWLGDDFPGNVARWKRAATGAQNQSFNLG